MLRNILASSRYLVIVAVLGIFLASIVVFVYGGITVISILIDTFSHGVFTVSGAKALAVGSIELIDLFLLGAVFYITSMGLFELFVDESLPMPSWLVITSLDDLEQRLIGVVIVLLAVSFLGYVVEWDNTTPILALGVAIGLVIFALSFFLRSHSHNHKIPLLSEAVEKENHQERLPLQEKDAIE
jgi:uncharacterized membrane protein YqhA